MVNLTTEQQTLLKWMNTGRSFKVYSGYGLDSREIIPASRLPIRVFIGTVMKLYRLGLIDYQPVKYFGQRWDEFTLTQKGKSLL